MPQPTTTARGVVPEVDVPDPPLTPIRPPPRNVSRPQPRLAEHEQIDGSTDGASEDEPTPPSESNQSKRPTITLSTTITHRNRLITISATDLTVDAFCDLLDKRRFAP